MGFLDFLVFLQCWKKISNGVRRKVLFDSMVELAVHGPLNMRGHTLNSLHSNTLRQDMSQALL